MAKSSEEWANSLQKFGQKNVKSAKNTELAQKWQRQMTGNNLTRKLHKLNWNVIGGVLIGSALVGSAYLGNELAKKHNQKVSRPKVIDVPESYTDDDGKVLDWSKCPEAYQPDENGRKNQIRVHMQTLGHPVVGDLRYGCESDPLGRLALHAFKLCFYHPVTGEMMQFETPYPAPFKTLMLRK